MVFSCGLAFALSGCSGASSPSAGPSDVDAGSGDAIADPNLELFSWWVAPGEAEALQALVSTYKDVYPKARVHKYTKTSAVDWETILGDNIETSPWDVVQMSAAAMPGFVIAHPGSLASVDEFYEEPAVKGNMIPDILKAVTFDGHARGVVTGIHRNNAFLFNLQIFEQQKLTPPTTIPEFLEVCAKLKAAGIVPITVSYDTWALRFMLNDILQGVLGAVAYNDYIKSITPADDPDLEKGVFDGRRYLRQDPERVRRRAHLDAGRLRLGGCDRNAALR